MDEGQEWRRGRRRVRRVHGLQYPLHPQQILAWIVTLVFVAFTFGALIPALHSSVAFPVSLAAGIIFLLHVLTHIAALFLDPADPQLRTQKKKLQIPEFNRTFHAHVIENGRCHLCNITTTSSRTKHCSACNKCVDVFDHHCKWLNHCIGKRNYKCFIALVATAIISCTVIMGLCITELVLYYFDREQLSPWERGRQTIQLSNKQKDKEDSETIPITCEAGSPYCHFVVFGGRVYDGAFIGILSTLFSVALIAEVLLLHLAAFHAYINCLGVTTYEYIRSNNIRDSSSAHSFSTYDGKRDPEGAVCGWTVVKRSSSSQITPSSTTDATLLASSSRESSTGSRSPRSSSSSLSPTTPSDVPCNSRLLGQSRHTSKDSSVEGNGLSKHQPLLPNASTGNSHSSSVPILPQIAQTKFVTSRSRIGFRSHRKTEPPKENEVDIRIVSVPRPRPSRRRMKFSVAPHLSPIKENDLANSSPPSLRLGNKAGDSNNTPRRSNQVKPTSYNLSSSPSSLPCDRSFQVETSRRESPPKVSHLSPSHSQVYPRPSNSARIFVVNEHKSSPAKTVNTNSHNLKSGSIACPKLMTDINGKKVAITILNGYIENLGIPPNRQNGHVGHSLEGSKVTFFQQRSEPVIKRGIRENSVIESSGNGTSHVELHM